MSFFVELWNSILQPGTNPALVKATHFSFAALLATLLFLLYATHNIHFVFLTLIASFLWAAITWFIREVEIEKLKQASISTETDTSKSKADSTAPSSTSEPSSSTTTSTSIKSPTSAQTHRKSRRT